MSVSYGGLDPLVVVPLAGGFIGMAVGLVTIWTSIKNSRQQQKRDIERSNIESENRLKEFFDLKLKLFESRLEQNYIYFKEWIQRIEKEKNEQ